MPSPAIKFIARIKEIAKPMLIQTTIAKTRIETFDKKHFASAFPVE
jgi:hypothetical protein